MRLIDADALLEKAVEADRMGAMLVVGKGFIMSAPTVVPTLDEMGMDDTTTVTRDVCYDHGEIINYGAYRCDKCGTKQPDKYPHCPGCGRRIERRSGNEQT